MRITATALCVVGTGLILASVAVVVLLHRSLLAQLDAQARMRADDVAVLVERGELPATLASNDDDTVAQVVSGGQVVAQSPVIRGHSPLWSFEPSTDIVRTVEEAPIGDGGAYRVAARRVDTPDGPVTVYAAASLDHLTDSMGRLEALLAIVVPALILLVGLTMWRLVGRTLEPVEAIRREVAEISATALDRRVPAPGTDDEIDRLARTMNEMLDRLDIAAQRQRTYVADASHELRSPLATIRAKLEVGLARPGTVDLPDLAAGWLAEQARLERLVDDLLLLARVDGSGPVRSLTVVDLDELVFAEARDLLARATVRIDVTEVDGGRVRGDAEQLRRVVRNLLDNAEHHATSTVRIGLRQSGDVIELTVSDDGPGIAPIQRERIFERFVRLGEAPNGRGGTGLGLSIVRDIVIAHGGTAEAVDAEQGARLEVRLPAAAWGGPESGGLADDQAGREDHRVGRRGPAAVSGQE